MFSWMLRRLMRAFGGTPTAPVVYTPSRAGDWIAVARTADWINPVRQGDWIDPP